MRPYFYIILLSAITLLNQSCEDSKVDSFEKGMIEINGTSLYVELAGEGEPIIVVHGGPLMDHSYLQQHLKALEESYQLIYYDQRVSGRSSVDVDTSEININAFTDDIEGIRRHFNLGKVHILAHSWGGLLAMEYALKYSEKTKSLLLISPMPPDNQLWLKEQTAQTKQMSSEDSIKRNQIIQSDFFSEDPPRAIEQLLRLSLKSQFVNSAPVESMELYVPEDYMKRSQLFGHLAPYLADYNLRGRLQGLSVPTLIIYGEIEPAAQISGPVLNQIIRNSKFHIVEGSGHFSFIEQKQQFNELVEEFLSHY